jgi:hypothetical protein
MTSTSTHPAADRLDELGARANIAEQEKGPSSPVTPSESATSATRATTSVRPEGYLLDGDGEVILHPDCEGSGCGECCDGLVTA